MDDWKDKLELRELIENWVILRDAGLWDKFRTGLARRRPHDGDLDPRDG